MPWQNQNTAWSTDAFPARCIYYQEGFLPKASHRAPVHAGEDRATVLLSLLWSTLVAGWTSSSHKGDQKSLQEKEGWERDSPGGGQNEWLG